MVKRRCGRDEAVQREPSAFKISHEQRHGLAVMARLAGDLAKNQVVAGQVRHDEGGTAFAGLQVGRREGQHHDFTD
jgi:hypothetical protein